MRYEEAIAVRKRQIANQPVDSYELATANRVIAHQRSMTRVFGNDCAVVAAPAAVGKPQPTRTPCPSGRISVSEWLRTLPHSESYQTKR